MIVKEIATCISLYKGAIDPTEFIAEVNEEINNPWSEIQWAHSSVGDGLVAEHRTSSEVDISHLEKIDSSMSKKFRPIAETILNEVLPDYREEHMVSTSSYEGWRLLKYSGGGEYHAHYDHSPKNSRIVSVVAFLETPLRGGELEFPFFNVSVSPIAGDVVVFPSNFPYVHTAHPVVAGTKCSLVTWLQ